MKNIVASIGILFLAFTAQAGDQMLVVDLNTLKTLPKLPVLTQGCEGECCGILKTKKALLEIQLYEAPSKSSKKIAAIKKGEMFEDAEFFTKILKFGEVREDGKKLTVVTYLSEGNSAVWDGKSIRATESDEGYKGPQTESWVQVKTKSGLKGWANLPPKDGKELDYGWCG